MKRKGFWREATEEDRRAMVADGLSPVYARTMRVFEPPVARLSKGWRRHVRRVKAQQRRAA